MLIELKIKRLHPDAVIPQYAKAGDAGLDLVAINRDWDPKTNCWTYATGIAMEIPEGYVGLIFPRSSICKYSLDLSNAVGVIDSGYRGDIGFKFRELANHRDQDCTIYKIGDKIGQLIVMPYPKVNIVEVQELSTSQRGTGGFGSTGA